MNACKQNALQKNKDLKRNNATLYRSLVYTVAVLLELVMYDGMMHQF